MGRAIVTSPGFLFSTSRCSTMDAQMFVWQVEYELLAEHSFLSLFLLSPCNNLRFVPITPNFFVLSKFPFRDYM